MPVAFLLAFGALVAGLHALDPRDPRRALVSEFAFDRPVLTGVAFVLLGAGVAGVAGVGVRVLCTRRWAWPGGALLVVAGTGVGLLTLFPTGHRGTVEPTTTVGEIHDTVASTSALVLTLGAVLAWPALRPAAALVVIAVVNAAFWLPAVLAPDAPGLLQRLWLGAVLVALVPLAIRARAFRGS